MKPSIDPQVLAELESDIIDVRDLVRRFSAQVIREGISQYPVYVAGHAPLPLGKPFLSSTLSELNFDYNASILEEFVSKGIVVKEKVEEFRLAYGNAVERACIFLALPEGGGFVFVSYQEQDDVSEEV